MKTSELKQAIHSEAMQARRQAIQAKRDTCVLQFDYDAASNRITSPGKFEGEPIFAPYYWQVGLEGFADSDDGAVYGFKFTNDGDDFEIWPELKQWLGRKRSLKLYEDSQGFVHCV